MKISTSLFFQIISLSCFAQFPSLHFENITTANGLSSNDITCFYQDHDGFLWIGTRFGLNRYDGHQFQTFYHDDNDSNSLSGNQIVDIIQDRQNIFWIATKDGGLTRYDPSQPKGKQFRQFVHNPRDSNSIFTNRLNALLDYNDDYLMIGAELYPIIFLNKHNFTFKVCSASNAGGQWIVLNPATNQFNKAYGNWLHKMVRIDSTIYLSFLSPPLVYKCQNDSFFNPQFVPLKRTDYINYNNSVLTIPDFCVEGDSIWCTSWKPGLFKQRAIRDSFDFANVNLMRFGRIQDVLSSVRVFDTRHLIASSASSGLYLVDKKNGETINYKHEPQDPFSIASNKTTALFKDRDGIWWIGTSGGISKFDPAQWQFHAEPIVRDPGHDITAFSVFRDGHQLRVCTSDGIYKQSSLNAPFQLFKFSVDGTERIPTLIHPYGNGKLALSTEIAFFQYDASAEQITKFPMPYTTDLSTTPYDMQTYQVRSMINDTVEGDPVLCYAVLGWGFGLYDLKTHHYYYMLHQDSILNSIGNNLSRKVVKDLTGTVWVATSGGLYKWNEKKFSKNDFTTYLHLPGDSTSLSSNDVQDIYVDENNHLWLATNGGGLNEFDGKKFTCYKAPMPQSNSMYGICADASNRFWIASASGFEVFNRSTKKFFHVEVDDPSLLLKPPSHILQDANQIMYGAGNFLVSFQPDSFHFDERYPKIYLTDFKIFNQSHRGDIKSSSSLQYAYDQNFFTINFSSLQLSGPGTVDYQYKLEGLDKQWTSTQTGTAIYTSLPPGNYTFEVKAANAVGDWSNPVSLISFEVNAPWWTRWWFYTLCIAVISLIIYLLVNYRIRQLMKIQRIRNAIANDLHDDVGSALSTISLYSEVAKMKAGMENGLEEILEKISSTSQEMQENMNYIVWSIQPRNDEFDQMILRIKQYAIEMLQPKNIAVHFSIDEKLHAMKLSTEQRKELFLIFKEAIHNITKYAQCKTVSISFTKSNHTVDMIIKDDGIGFEISNESAGNGLHTMKERAAALKGRLIIYSEVGKGTDLSLSFPL